MIKACKGCGAFFNKRCEYCGYIDENWTDADAYEFTTLKVHGNRNILKIKYGEAIKDEFVVKGREQIASIKAKVINIVVTGNENIIKVKRKIKYSSVVNGNRNIIK